MKRLWMVLVLFGLAASASAGTYYVRKTGNDTTGNGSDALPWLTIQKAENTIPIAGGHTVYIGAGTYAEDNGAQNYLRFGRSYVSPVTFRPEDGAAVIITGEGTGGASITFASSTTNVTLDGMNSGGASMAVNLAGTDLYNIQSIGTTGVSGITLRNLIVTNGVNNGIGIYFGNGTQTGITIENVTVTASGATSYGIQIYGAAASWLSTVAITNCTVTGATAGLHIFSGGRVDGLTVTGGTYTASSAGNTVAIGRWEAAFTGIVKNVTISGVTTAGLGRGIQLGGTVGAPMETVTLTNNTVDASAATQAGVILGAYITGITVTGGFYDGATADGTKGGMYLIGPITTAAFSGATFSATEPGELALGLEGVDGATIDSCFFQGEGRSIVIQTGTVNVTVTNNVTDSWDMGIRIGHDGTTDYNNDNITVTGNTFRSLKTAGAIIGSGVTNVTFSNNTVYGGGSIMRFRGHADNAGISVTNNLLIQNPADAEVADAAVTWYGARNVTFTGNTVIASLPSMMKTFLNGALTNLSNTITGNRFSMRGAANLYNWQTAHDGTGNVFSNNIFTQCGSGDFGAVLADGDVDDYAQLRTAWAGYGDGSNDLVATFMRSSSRTIGQSSGISVGNIADCLHIRISR